MSLPGTCPSCGYHGEIEAFLIEPDAKRAVARAAALDAAVGRALPAYLRLFVPGKRGLRLNRAVRLIDELAALIVRSFLVSPMMQTRTLSASARPTSSQQARGE